MTQFETLCSVAHLKKAWEDVKSKKAGGGVDGETLSTFEVNLLPNLEILSRELKTGQWKPFPYLRIVIPKKKTEKRQIGMLSIRDKIVQQGIRLLIEPICEKVFYPCSYAYRPGKGAVSAIKRLRKLCAKDGNRFVLRLDIDDYFNHIDHEILASRLRGITQDPEIQRLVMLCVKMGAVSKDNDWKESEEGLHQGAVLSPCLANLYLHSFDQFVLSVTKEYVRYADDFVILCPNREFAVKMLADAESYLKQRLHATLNSPVISEIKDGFEFLGIRLDKQTISLAEQKQSDIHEHIGTFYLTQNGLKGVDSKRWKGIRAYYGELLSQAELQVLDQALYAVLEKNISMNWRKFPRKEAVAEALKDIEFITEDFRYHSAAIKDQLLNTYLSCKHVDADTEMHSTNRKLILSRKHEYRKKEAEHAELVVTRPGMALGLAKNRVTLKENGILIASIPPANLKHVSVQSAGVSISSNLLAFLMENKIPLDLFTRKGHHVGSFLSPSSLQCLLWAKQSDCPSERRNRLAGALIEGKLTNQLNLVKYFHKYHKARTEEYRSLVEELDQHVKSFKAFLSSKPYGNDGFIQNLTTFEAQGALKYWAYVRSLLADDAVGFEGRVQQGAQDVVNSMLNYGYAILYTRIWEALLWAQLNPYDSIIHVRQSGKPTFSYDVIELFRAQAVDRVVISLVQKKEPLAVQDGLLTDESRKLLAKNITERLQKREKYRGEELSLDTIIRRQAQEIADFFQEGSRYLPYKAKW